MRFWIESQLPHEVLAHTFALSLAALKVRDGTVQRAERAFLKTRPSGFRGRRARFGGGKRWCVRTQIVQDPRKGILCGQG